MLAYRQISNDLWLECRRPSYSATRGQLIPPGCFTIRGDGLIVKQKPLEAAMAYRPCGTICRT